MIDTNRYVGKAPEKRVEGGIIQPRVELLMAKGSDKTALVEGVLTQVRHERRRETFALQRFDGVDDVDRGWVPAARGGRREVFGAHMGDFGKARQGSQ